MPEVHAIVSGYVQGVNFRYYAVKEAQKLGLKGFVRNLSDGSVEVIAQGKKQELERLIEWLQNGPSSAEVSKVELEWREKGKEFKGFSIRH